MQIAVVQIAKMKQPDQRFRGGFEGVGSAGSILTVYHNDEGLQERKGNAMETGNVAQ